MSLLSVLSILAGLFVLGFMLYDVFKTVLIIGGGAGPQSNFMADRLWRLALRFHDPKSEMSHSWMRAAGPCIVLLALATWVMELCLSWALIFVPEAFKTPLAVDFSDRFVFAGKAVIGRSGNSPALEVNGGFWEMIQSTAGTSGVIIVSVGLAYVLPILGAVAHSRSTAAMVNTLGNTPKGMAALSKSSETGAFEQHLLALVGSISLVAERYRSYPVLHYFHSKDAHASLAPAVAKLALLVRSDTPGAEKIDPGAAKPMNRAILNLLEALGRMGLTRYAKETDNIEDSRIKQITVNPLAAPSMNEQPSDQWLKAFVQFDGWNWEEISEEQPD